MAKAREIILEGYFGPFFSFVVISLHNITYATQYALFLLFFCNQLFTKITKLLKSSKTTNCAFVDIDAMDWDYFSD